MIKFPARILVVDDDPDLLLLLRSTLRYEGFSAAVATDGGIAIDMIDRDPPHVVLLDIMMPHLDGWAVLEACARKSGSPTFIVVSAKASDEDRVRALELGAVEYVTKPFDPRELIAIVNAVLALPESEGEQGPGPRPPGIGSNAPGPDSGEAVASG